MVDDFEKKGRGPAPTQQELEFLFAWFQRGYEDKDIERQYAETDFPERDRRFIRSQRRYFDAARKVLGESIKAEQDPLIVEARRHHQKQLLQEADLIRNRLVKANSLIRNRLFLSDLPCFCVLVPNREEARAELSLARRCLWEHLSGQQEAKDYQEFWQTVDKLENECKRIENSIDIAAKAACQLVRERLADYCRPKPTLESDDLLGRVKAQWGGFVNACRGCGEGGNLDALMRRACEPMAIEGNTLVLGFYHDFHIRKFEEPKGRLLVKQKLAEYFQFPFELRCVRIPKPSSKNYRIDEHTFGDTVYRLAVLGPGNEKNPKQDESPYRLVVNKNEDSSTLHVSHVDDEYISSTQFLACLPVKLMKLLQETHKSLVRKYGVSEQGEQVHLMVRTLQDTGQRLEQEFELLIATGTLTGKCRACA